MLRTGELLDPLKGLCHGASPVGSRLAAAVSYRAAWSLPGPDSHWLVDVSLHEITRLPDPPPSSGVPLPGHAGTGSTPTGSGATEKTVDVLVSHRYKKRGMSWGRSGSGALMRLRLLKANGEWDAYWDRRRATFARRAA